MAFSSKSCEEIAISFLGEVQDIGFLIITDFNYIIESHSDNTHEHLGEEWLYALQKHFINEISNQSIISNDQIERILNAIQKNDFLESFDLLINNEKFHLTIHATDDNLFFEFELHANEPIMNMHRINAKVLGIQQAENDVWQLLCQYLQDIVNMDRVMIYQFNEDQSGMVIAESLTDSSLDSYLRFNYPEFDIPAQARALYVKKHCRFVTDIHNKTSKLISTNKSIDLSVVNIRALAAIHLEYLNNAGFQSSISFSIIINDMLWGMVCCQSSRPRHIDLANRNLALALTYSAAAKYQEQRNIKLHLFKTHVQEFELLLKEKLLLKIDPIEELNHVAQDLIKFMRSDGLALVSKDHNYIHGYTPNVGDIKTLLDTIIAKNKGNNLLVTQHIQELMPAIPESCKAFPGVATFIINSGEYISIIWFRKELSLERKWAGIPEKIATQQHDSQGPIRPRKSFALWMESVQGHAIPWNERQKYFLTRIKQVVYNALIQKSQEIEQLNRKLIERNNALDTYAYTVSHDLKNPLTAIKLSAQFLQQRHDFDSETSKKMMTRITDSVDQISSMLDRIHELATANAITFQKERIELSHMIEEIIFQCKARFANSKTIVKTNNIIPIYGEKTLIYQLFLNIIGNAIKYSSKQENPQVTIYAEMDQAFDTYYIEDNGIGMEESDITDIFQIFKRMDNAKSYEGYGIGMSIVKRIIDKLDIQMKISSVINQGTVISLTFPHAS